MPIFNVQAEVTTLDPLDQVKTITPVTLTADTNTDLLEVDLTRKGHAVKNTSTGSVVVNVDYGLTAPEGVGFTTIYSVSLKPGEVYLHDEVAIIPYRAKSIGSNGSLSVLEFG